MGNKHRFVIGIGSQRAGSTLLHRLLDESTEVFMHPVKELHYFDTLYGIRPEEALREYSLRQVAREIDRIVGGKDLDFIGKRYRCYLRTNRIMGMTSIQNVNYLDLFRPCLMGKSMLGEVTPEYMLLNDDSISKMRTVIGDDASIILICRNPVQRILSAAKLMNVYNGMNMDDDAAEQWLNRMMDENNSWICSQDGYNDYSSTIERYSKHFSRFCAISYDELISNPRKVAANIESVCELKVDHDAFESGVGRVSNDLGSSFNISDDLVNTLTARYQGSQEFLNHFFGFNLVR